MIALLFKKLFGGWVKWLVGAGLIALIILLVANWDHKRLGGAKQQGFDNAISKVNKSTSDIKQRDQKDAKAINDDIQYKPISDIDELLSHSIPSGGSQRADMPRRLGESTVESRGSRVDPIYTRTYKAVPSEKRHSMGGVPKNMPAGCIESYSINPNTNEIEKGCY